MGNRLFIRHWSSPELFLVLVQQILDSEWEENTGQGIILESVISFYSEKAWFGNDDKVSPTVNMLL